MELKNLPKVTFAEVDPTVVEKDLVGVINKHMGRTLARADPLMLFAKSIAAYIVQQHVLIDYTGHQNLLADADGDNLDCMGVLVGADRLMDSAATTTMRLTLSAIRETTTTIPAGTRFTAGDSIYFALDENALIPPGETSVLASATCTETGEQGNDYAAGEIIRIVDPVPFLQEVENITTSGGGAGVEKDDPYRERIHEAPESFSVAGPSGAYEYWIKTASALIVDAKAMGPDEPEAPDRVPAGEVWCYALLKGGLLPGEEIKADIDAILQKRDKRPLTDKVSVLDPEVVGFAVDVTYYIDRNDATAAQVIQTATEAAVNDWVLWQKSKLGRDINVSKLYEVIRAAGAKRAAIVSPAYQKIYKWQVAIASSVRIVFGGLEDE